MLKKVSTCVSRPVAVFAAGLLACSSGLAPALAADPPPLTGPKAGDQPGRGSDGKSGPEKPGPGKTGPAGDPKAAAAARTKSGTPVLAIPKTPQQREKSLADLYAQLAAAEDEGAAKRYAAQIERVWLEARGDTVGLLMERALAAANAKNFDLSIKLLDAVVELQPDFAEGWNRRAYVNFLRNNVQGALGDLRRVLALDPNHFKALDGLAQVLREIGEKKAALAALRTLIEVHPYWSGARKQIDDLAREVDGQRI